MKKIKYLLIAFALVVSCGFINVNAEAPVPGSIVTKENLLYYIQYYGGSATLDGNKITLTSNLTTYSQLSFSNTKDLIIDLNGYGMYFGDDAGIMIYSGSKNITFTDSSNKETDYIKANNNITIYNASSNVLTIENTKLVSTSNTKSVLYAYGSSKNNITNTIIASYGQGITAGANSKFFVKNSNIELTNSTCLNGVELAGSNAYVQLDNTDVSVSDTSTTGVALLSNSTTSELVVNGGNIKAYVNALYVQNGKVTINSGTFTGVSQYALRADAATNVTINGGHFISNRMAGIQFINGAFVTLNSAKITAGPSMGAIAMPMNASLSSYIPVGHQIDNSAVDTNYGMTYTTATEVNIIALPKTAKLSYTAYTYNGYVKTPTVTITNYDGKKLVKGTDYTLTYQTGRKYVGKYYVKITCTGAYANLPSKTLYFTIKPKATYLTSLTSGSKSFTVKIKKSTIQTTGYQIMYSTSSKFSTYKTYKMKNTATVKTFKYKKAKTKYYVKVRTYKVVNGVTYYSNWSLTKAITTKA